MNASTKGVGVLALGMLLGSGSCILACGCERPPSGVVQGSVRAEAAEGVPNAALELRQESGVEWVHTVVTDGAGAFVFEDVPAPADYTLTVQPPEGWTLAPGQVSSVSLSVAGSARVDADFTLRAP